MGKRLGVSEDCLATGTERDDGQASLVEAEIALRLDERELAAQRYAAALEAATTGEERAGALAGLGQLAFREGRPREAIARLEEARALWRNDFADYPASAETLGRAYAALDELDPAVEIFRRSLATAEERKDPLETVRFAVLLANAHIDQNDFAEAKQLLEKAVASAPDSSDPLFRARLYWSQSRLYSAQEDPARAARYARKALNLLELTEHTYYAAQAHQLLAHIELDRNKPEVALELLQQGLELLGDAGNVLDRALFKLEEARALIQLGSHEQAGGLAMEASGLLSDAMPEDAGRGYALVAEVFAELGDRAKARELYELAAQMLEGGPRRYAFEVYQKLAELLEADGQTEEALGVLKKAVAVQSQPSR